MGASKYFLEPALVPFGNQKGHLLDVGGHNAQHDYRRWLLHLVNWGDIADMIGQKEMVSGIPLLVHHPVLYVFCALGHKANLTHSLSWHPAWIFVDQFWMFIAH